MISKKIWKCYKYFWIIQFLQIIFFFNKYNSIMKVNCPKCSKIYNFDDNLIWNKWKCSCWEFFEVNLLDGNNCQFKYLDLLYNFKTIILILFIPVITFLLSLILISFRFNQIFSFKIFEMYFTLFLFLFILFFVSNLLIWIWFKAWLVKKWAGNIYFLLSFIFFIFWIIKIYYFEKSFREFSTIIEFNWIVFYFTNFISVFVNRIWTSRKIKLFFLKFILSLLVFEMLIFTLIFWLWRLG